MKKIYLSILLITLCFVSCGKGKNTPEETDNDSTIVTDSLIADTAVYKGGGKSLNDIRFADFDENDWLDNEYIRCLRRYIDDYNNGKILDENLDEYKDKLKGRFIIARCEPALLGGLSLQISFIDNPDDIFFAWIYSVVDEEQEKILGYEVRYFSIDEEKSGFTKDEILELMKKHAELKPW